MTIRRKVPPRLLSAAVVSLCLAIMFPAVGVAEVLNSPHDFRDKGFANYGLCSPCHIPHKTWDNALWPRDLRGNGSDPDYERVYFGQSSEPNYRPAATVLCYDCHVDATNSTPTPNNTPSGWTAGHYPQDIAFTDGPGKNDPEDFVGYYEMSDGSVPIYGDSIDVTKPTGGHYWKDDPTGAPAWEKGDKLECALCHDPHDNFTGLTNKNDCMIRTRISDGQSGYIDMGEGLKASPAARNHTIDPNNGRDTCAKCHAYYDTGTPVTMWRVQVPRPTNLKVHLSTDPNKTACTYCHRHNYITAACTQCHGYPPPPAASGYGSDESSGPHPRHAKPFNEGYGYTCFVCHYNFPSMHNTNGTFKDVAFDTAYSPSGSYASNTSTCNSTYCHSRGTYIDDTVNGNGSNAVVWNFTNWDTQNKPCNSCHGTSTVASGSVRYGAPAYANRTSVNGKQKANSHATHPFRCSICHWNVTQDTEPSDGWTITIQSNHVNNTTAGFSFNVNPDPNLSPSPFGTYTYRSDGGTCTVIECHAGASAQWGTNSVAIRQDCKACHLRSESAGGDRDDWTVPTSNYSAAKVSSDYWSNTGHGRASGSFPWPNTTPAISGFTNDQPDLSCWSSEAGNPLGATRGCHITSALHLQADNPFRLVTKDDGGTYAFEWPANVINENSVVQLCATCHATSIIMTHSQAITGGDNWGQPPSAPVFYRCTDCHDPHGDAPDYMIHDKVMADSSNNYGVASTSDRGLRPQSNTIDFNFTSPNGAVGDFVNATSYNERKICQVCHQTNTAYSVANTELDHMGGGFCLECHPHELGFTPTNCVDCHSGNPPPENALAPDVVRGIMSVDAAWDGSWWDNNPTLNGAQTVNQGGHGDPDGLPAVSCTACHTTGDPPSTHLDDIVQSAESGLNRNNNTAHLRAFFFDNEPFAYSVQVNFDRGCYQQCHQGLGIVNMRHSLSSSPAPGVAQFGRHSTYSDVDNTPGLFPFPVDSDLTTRATVGPWPDDTDYAPCVSCHDPHGTKVIDHKGTSVLKSNRMCRDSWFKGSTLCLKCHY